MDRVQLAGINYQIHGRTVKFFGAKGVKLRDDLWEVNDVQIAPDSVMPAIRSCIADDVARGRGDSVAQLHLSATRAVILFLEGRLTHEHFVDVAEGTGYINIPRVMIDGRVLTVRIMPNPAYEVATADCFGVVLL